jgi:hypothetical protein
MYKKHYSLQLPGWVVRTSSIHLFVALFPSKSGSYFFSGSDDFCLRLRKDESQVFLESVIATPALPPAIIDSLSSQLIKIAVKSEDETDKHIVARRLLSLIHQRYPHSLRSAANLLSNEDESLKEALDQLVITLSIVRLFIATFRLHWSETLTGQDFNPAESK